MSATSATVELAPQRGSVITGASTGIGRARASERRGSSTGALRRPVDLLLSCRGRYRCSPVITTTFGRESGGDLLS